MYQVFFYNSLILTFVFFSPVAIPWFVEDHWAMLASQWRGPCHCSSREEKPLQLAVHTWQEQVVEQGQARWLAIIQVAAVDSTALSL